MAIMVKQLLFTSLSVFSIAFVLPAQQTTAPMKNQENIVFSEIKLYPNPLIAGNSLNVSLNGYVSDNLLVVVYDTFGRETYSKVAIYESGGYYFSIDNENRLPAGVYIVIASANDQVFRQRLVVK